MNIKSLTQNQYVKFMREKKKIMSLIIVIVSLFLIMLLFKCCHAIISKDQSQFKPIMLREGNQIIIPSYSALRKKIKLKTVSYLNTPHMVSLPGIVEAYPTRTVDVLPPLTGKLVSINVNLGDFVKKGQVLAVINSPDLAQAYSDNEKARSLHKLMSESLKLAQKVNSIGGNALKDVQMAENDALQALAEVNRTADKLKTLGHNTFGVLTIRAPIKGQITSLNYGIGSYINDHTETLLSISNIDLLWVTINVPENLVGLVKKGQRVSINLSAYPNQTWDGKIAFINSLIDPGTRSNKTRVEILNHDGKLQPNMYATAHLFVLQPYMVMIPISALQMNDDTTSVYVEIAPWRFQRRKVQLGMEDGKEVRVISGLKPGERIAICGGIFLND